jgi:hypothetical protein
VKDITGLIIIHNDAQMLQKALDSVSDIVSKLIVVDGAYEWVAPFSYLNGENAESSSDDLLEILKQSEIPYEVFTGIWKNESHKRLFSIEQCKTDFALLIDSDEVFELDKTLVDEFMCSGKGIAECLFPLYYSPECIGINPNFGGPTRKSALLNLKDFSATEIVDSLFLLVPEDERIKGITNQQRFKKTIGTIHHLSIFRFGQEAYRRARFYNLLSMRINKKLSVVDEKEFENDEQFFNLITALSENNLSALDNFFRFHKISASFPVIKSNQVIIKSEANEKIKKIVCDCYSEMIAQHYNSLVDISKKRIRYFFNKPMFIDVTKVSQIKPFIEFNIYDDESVLVNYNLYHEKDGERRIIKNSSSHNHKISFPETLDFDRAVLEITFVANANTFELGINF